MDHRVICECAIGALGRKGVFRWIERDELISVGYLALVTAQIEDDALGVIVARRAMLNAIDANEVRQRGRVEVRESDANNPEQSNSDQWDALICGGQSLRPEGQYVDLWDSIKALPAQQYRAIVLSYWVGLTQREIAIEMGVNQQRVAKILCAAKINMRSLVVKQKPQLMTHMRGTEVQRTALSGRMVRAKASI